MKTSEPKQTKEEILEYYDIDDHGNKLVTWETALKAMQEYAAIQVAKALDKPNDEDIEEYLLKKYPPLFVDDNGNPFDVNKLFRESALVDIKAALNGEIKKKVK